MEICGQSRSFGQVQNTNFGENNQNKSLKKKDLRRKKSDLKYLEKQINEQLNEMRSRHS